MNISIYSLAFRYLPAPPCELPRKHFPRHGAPAQPVFPPSAPRTPSVRHRRAWRIQHGRDGRG